MNTVEILKAAKELLVAKGWTHGGYLGPNGCLCAVSAINVASARRPAEDVPCGDPAGVALAEAMGLVDIDFVEWGIIGWNDAIGRTVEEVLAVFDKAIAAEEAKGA